MDKATLIRVAVRQAVRAMREYTDLYDAEWTPEGFTGSVRLSGRADVLSVAVLKLSHLTGRRQRDIRSWLDATFTH